MSYPVGEARKRASYWVMGHVDGDFAPNHEVDAVEWHKPALARDRMSHPVERTIMADFGYSACCMAYGAVLITAGFLRRNAFLRWQALVLFALSIALIFLNGISLQGQGYRVLSFLGLGVLLLVVSFVYQKDWLHLRG